MLWSPWWGLRRHGTLQQSAAGFGISVGTAHTCTTAVIRLLAGSDRDYVLPDGTLAECDRVWATAGPTTPSSTAGTA